MKAMADLPLTSIRTGFCSSSLAAVTVIQRPLVVCVHRARRVFLGTQNVMFFSSHHSLLFCDTVVPLLGRPGNDFYSVKIDLEPEIPTKHTSKPLPGESSGIVDAVFGSNCSFWLDQT